MLIHTTMLASTLLTLAGAAPAPAPMAAATAAPVFTVGEGLSLAGVCVGCATLRAINAIQQSNVEIAAKRQREEAAAAKRSDKRNKEAQQEERIKNIARSNRLHAESMSRQEEHARVGQANISLLTEAASSSALAQSAAAEALLHQSEHLNPTKRASLEGRAQRSAAVAEKVKQSASTGNLSGMASRSGSGAHLPLGGEGAPRPGMGSSGSLPEPASKPTSAAVHAKARNVGDYKPKMKETHELPERALKPQPDIDAGGQPIKDERGNVRMVPQPDHEGYCSKKDCQKRNQADKAKERLQKTYRAQDNQAFRKQDDYAKKAEFDRLHDPYGWGFLKKKAGLAKEPVPSTANTSSFAGNSSLKTGWSAAAARESIHGGDEVLNERFTRDNARRVSTGTASKPMQPLSRAQWDAREKQKEEARQKNYPHLDANRTKDHEERMKRNAAAELAKENKRLGNALLPSTSGPNRQPKKGFVQAVHDGVMRCIGALCREKKEKSDEEMANLSRQEGLHLPPGSSRRETGGNSPPPGRGQPTPHDGSLTGPRLQHRANTGDSAEGTQGHHPGHNQAQPQGTPASHPDTGPLSRTNPRARDRPNLRTLSTIPSEAGNQTPHASEHHEDRHSLLDSSHSNSSDPQHSVPDRSPSAQRQLSPVHELPHPLQPGPSGALSTSASVAPGDHRHGVKDVPRNDLKRVNSDPPLGLNKAGKEPGLPRRSGQPLVGMHIQEIPGFKGGSRSGSAASADTRKPYPQGVPPSHPVRTEGHGSGNYAQAAGQRPRTAPAVAPPQSRRSLPAPQHGSPMGLQRAPTTAHQTLPDPSTLHQPSQPPPHQSSPQSTPRAPLRQGTQTRKTQQPAATAPHQTTPRSTPQHPLAPPGGIGRYGGTPRVSTNPASAMPVRSPPPPPPQARTGSGQGQKSAGTPPPQQKSPTKKGH